MKFIYRGPRELHEKRKPAMPKHTLCTYCKLMYADSWDHIIPYSYGGLETPDNLIPCCRNCNSIISNLLFYSAQEKWLFIQLIIKCKYTRIKAYTLVENDRSARVSGTGQVGLDDRPFPTLLEWLRIQLKNRYPGKKPIALIEAKSLTVQSVKAPPRFTTRMERLLAPIRLPSPKELVRMKRYRGA